MKSLNNEKIDSYIKNTSQVKLYYFEDEICGQILSHSKNFILIRDVKDWHFDGYMIFPKKYISKVRYSKVEKFRENLMKKFLNKVSIFDIKWLKLNSFKDIFESLHSNYPEVCIEGATECVNQFKIGKIVNYTKKELYINELNIYAKLSSKELRIPIKDITCIYFKDEYSSILFSFENSRP